MLKIITIFISLFLLISNLKAEVVSKLSIKGNQRVSIETIKVYGEIEVGKDYSDTDLNLILKKLYETNFFEDIKINLTNNVLTLNLKEYPIVNQLIITGEDSKRYKEQIKKIIKLKQKGSFIRSYLSNDINLIKQLYSSLGYNFAEVQTKINEIDKGKYDLLIEIDRGEKTKISTIKFIGNDNIRTNRLRDVVASEESKFWKVLSRNTNFSENLINLDIRLLTNYYKSIGFYDVKIVSNFAEINDKNNIDLVYTIDEGNRFRLNKISLNVDSIFNKDLFFPLEKEFNKYVGEYYSPFKIKKLLDKIDELIDNNSLQFVEHNVEEILGDGTIDIKFNIFEGNKVLVERINVLGNNVTNEDVIRGELLVDEGDPFTNLSLDKSVSKLKSRNIFNRVTSKILDGSKSDLKVINIEVEEKPTGEISAGAGVGTNGGSFAFTIRENNWLGEGKNVAFNIEVDEESLKGSLNYVNPNYNFLGNSLSYSLSSTTNDKPDQGFKNTIVAASAGTRFEQYKDIFAKLGLSISYDDLQTLDNASASLKKQSGEFTELSANYGFSYDKRNRAFMPTDGSIVSFEQSLPLYADKAFIENTLASSNYISINENIIGAAKFYLTGVNGLGGEDVRLSKRKNLSTKRLRGFQRGKVGPVDGDDHIGGNYAAAINFEAQLPNFLPESSNTDVGLFLDFGNIWGVDYDGSIDDSNKIRSSTGVAASWISPLGPMTFILSTNLSKSGTDKTEGFNFNLGTTF